MARSFFTVFFSFGLLLSIGFGQTGASDLSSENKSPSPASPKKEEGSSEPGAPTKDSLVIPEEKGVWKKGMEKSVSDKEGNSNSAGKSNALAEGQKFQETSVLDSTYIDTAKFFKPGEFFEESYSCHNYAQSAVGCFRKLNHTASMEVGFPGVVSRSLSLKNYQSIKYQPYYATGLNYSPYELGGVISPVSINGKLNGMEIKEVPFLPTRLDTPQTEVVWERGALSLNSFRIRASRMTTQNSYLALDLMSQGLDSIKYEYSFQVHQPYVSDFVGLGKSIPFLDRDSSNIVIAGVSPKVSVFHLRPRLGIYFTPDILFELYFDHYSNKSQLSSPRSDTAVYDFFEEQQQVSLNSEFNTSTVGGNVFSHQNWGKVQVNYAHGSSEIKPTSIKPEAFSGLDLVVDTVDQDTSPTLELDTNFVPVTGKEGFSVTTDKIEAEVTLTQLMFEPKVEFGLISRIIEGDLWTQFNANNSKITSKPRTKGWEDEEYLSVNWKPNWKMIKGEMETGMERKSLLIDEVKYLWNGSIHAEAEIPYGFDVHAGYDLHSRQPNWKRMHQVNSIEFTFANPNLTHEVFQRVELGVGYQYSFFHFAANFYSNTIDDVMLPGLLPFDSVPATEDSIALRWINYKEEVRNILNLQMGIHLGNWSLALEYSRMLENQIKGSQPQLNQEDYNPLIPKVITKGRLAWGNSFVSDRMNLKVWWDWEWFSHRHAWAPNLKGQSIPVKLDEFLSLDFNVQMRIKTFTLYYNIKNFNHDRYTLQPGYHPPGVNFRWGVHWQMNG